MISVSHLGNAVQIYVIIYTARISGPYSVFLLGLRAVGQNEGFEYLCYLHNCPPPHPISVPGYNFGLSEARALPLGIAGGTLSTALFALLSKLLFLQKGLM